MEHIKTGDFCALGKMNDMLDEAFFFKANSFKHNSLWLKIRSIIYPDSGASLPSRAEMRIIKGAFEYEYKADNGYLERLLTKVFGE